MVSARTSAKTCALSRGFSGGAAPPGVWHAVHVRSICSGESNDVAIEPWQVTQLGPRPSLVRRAKWTLERK
jgi:hypothetical protein